LLGTLASTIDYALLVLSINLIVYPVFLDKRQWVLMKFEGDLPANRLDHSMCVVPWMTAEDVDSGESETKHLAFIFGGMDTQGVIHRDCVVTILT